MTNITKQATKVKKAKELCKKCRHLEKWHWKTHGLFNCYHKCTCNGFVPQSKQTAKLVKLPKECKHEWRQYINPQCFPITPYSGGGIGRYPEFYCIKCLKKCIKD